MKKSWKVIVPLLLVLVLLLTSCGNKKDPEVLNEPEELETEDVEQDEVVAEEEDPLARFNLPHPQIIQKEGETVGGTLNVALVSATPFEGMFNSFLYTGNPDSKLMSPMWGEFMKSGPNFEIVDGGYCDVEFDRDEKSATYKIHKDLTWSDGVPVTADDLIYVYETIAHPDYTGVRFDSDYRNVAGIEEYNRGEAEAISGLEKVDDKTLKVTFKEFYPGILWGAGLTYHPEPKHYLENIPVKDLEASDEVRVKPLSCGPFVMSSVVPGESIEYIPNPHWFGEEPKVDKIVYIRTNPDTIVEALKSGTFDLIAEVNVDAYEEYKDLPNIELLSNVDNVYGYMGFKLGKWNTETKKVEMNPDMKMSDVNLRTAMAYAMDNDEVAEIFYNGLRVTANAMIDPAHSTYWHSELEGHKYDPDKANKILDDAGYIDVDGDGLREDPDGNKLTINFAAMSGGEIAEPLAQFYIQNWRDIGLDVQLLDGRLIEFNAFYEMVEKDREDLDMWMGGWGTGSNPDPSGLWGRDSLFNYPRFATEENDRLLAAIASEDAFGDDGGVDDEYLIKAYQEWQEHIFTEVPFALTHYRVRVAAINNRVNYYDINTVSDWGWEKVGLLADTPEKAN